VSPTADDRVWFEHEVLGALRDLLGTARQLRRNRADAEDLVAEAVARAWIKLDTLEDRGRFRGWIFRILTNLYRADCRSRAVRGDQESLEEGEENFSLFERLHQPFLLWWGNPEQEFLDRLLREDLETAIEALPEEFRLAVVLADVQGFSYQEISDLVGVPIGTVRSRLSRGRSLLQKALWRHANDAGLRQAHQGKESGP
jgi:RNA polymerase sigma-70 factor (ECF subfamily)